MKQKSKVYISRTAAYFPLVLKPTWSILWCPVLFPTGDALTLKEDPGSYFLMQGGTAAPELFWKADARDLKAQTDDHQPRAGHSASSSWNPSTWKLDVVLWRNFLHRGRYFSSAPKVIYLQEYSTRRRDLQGPQPCRTHPFHQTPRASPKDGSIQLLPI